MRLSFGLMGTSKKPGWTFRGSLISVFLILALNIYAQTSGGETNAAAENANAESAFDQPPSGEANASVNANTSNNDAVNASVVNSGAASRGSLSALQNYQTGRNLEARNRMAEAETYYNEAVRICQEEVSRNAATRETYTIITWVLRRQNKYADTITWGERGLRLYPTEYRIMETLGEAWFYLSDYNRSLSYMQRYANAVPQGERTSVAYFFIGEIFRITQRYLHADIAYTTAVRLDPGMSLWWYRLGEVRAAAGDRESAAEAYRQAIRLNPDYREAINGLARVQTPQ